MSTPTIYSTLAHNYDELLGKSRAQVKRDAADIQMLLDEHSPKNDMDTLLDVGCGTGVHARELQHLYDVTGVDVSYDMLRAGREKHPIRDVDLVQGDIHSLPFTDEFDAVVSIFDTVTLVASSVDELTEVFEEFYSVIDGEGVAIVEATPVPDAKVDTGDKQVHVAPRDGTRAQAPTVIAVQVSEIKKSEQVITIDYTHVHEDGSISHDTDRFVYTFFTSEEIEEAFRRAGFEVVDHDPRAFSHTGFVAKTT